MKDPRFLTFRPTYHWTDQKLRVHVLYCVLALMVMSLLRRKLQQAGISMSISRIAERLEEINEVVSVYPTPKGSPLRIQATLSQCDAEQEAMLAALQLSSYIAK